MSVNLWRTDVGVNPTPGIERFRFVVVILFRMMFMVVMGMFMVVMVVQMMTVHIHAAVEVTIRLMHHRPRNILLGIAQQHGQHISARNRLRHLRGGDLRQHPHKYPKHRKCAVWNQPFLRRFLVKRKCARNSNAAE